MPPAVTLFDRELDESAAHLKAEHDLGRADTFTAAFVKSRKARLVTADSEFKPVDKEIKINWLK